MDGSSADDEEDDSTTASGHLESRGRLMCCLWDGFLSLGVFDGSAFAAPVVSRALNQLSVPLNAGRVNRVLCKRVFLAYSTCLASKPQFGRLKLFARKQIQPTTNHPRAGFK